MKERKNLITYSIYVILLSLAHIVLSISGYEFLNWKIFVFMSGYFIFGYIVCLWHRYLTEFLDRTKTENWTKNSLKLLKESYKKSTPEQRQKLRDKVNAQGHEGPTIQEYFSGLYNLTSENSIPTIKNSIFYKEYCDEFNVDINKEPDIYFFDWVKNRKL